MTPDPNRMRAVAPLRAAAAGALAAGASLTAGRLGATVLDGTADPVVAVGGQVVDRTPGIVREAVIGGVGTADKPLLVASVTVTVLLLGAAVGLLRRRSRAFALALVAVLWTVGGLAVGDAPGTTAAGAVLLAASSALIGVLVLDLLVPPRDAPPAAAAPAVRVAHLSRRAFVQRTGGVLAVVGAALATGNALSARALHGARGLLAVPARRAVRPDTSTAVPGRTPLVTSNSALYRIDTALQTPAVDPDSWSLKVTGLVDRQLTFTYQDLQRMPQVEAWITIGCVGNEVGGDLVGTALWQGVPLADLLRTAGVRAGATQVVGRSVDGYTGAFPLPLALDGRDALVAVGMNGQPLPPAHGFPARLVVPGLYGYESAVKWLSEIQLADDSYRAYWVRRGYARAAEFRTQSRIDLPREGSTVTSGPVTVAGMAWAPHRGVSAVEVQVDGGPWLAADLEPDQLGPDAWRPWSRTVRLTPGAHTIAVRATDGQGVVQPADRRAVLPDGATGHHTLSLRAA